MTLPLTYARVAEHPRVLDIYSHKLAAQGLVTLDEIAAWKARALGCTLLSRSCVAVSIACCNEDASSKKQHES